MSSLDGKVAVITGAAHGLGREHALYLAKHGARIVVNDIGADVDGAGRDSKAAQQVVDEIAASGGSAVAHTGDAASFADAESLVARAVESFGGLDIMICNAGFSRDSIIYNMSEQDFDDVIRVHLKGHFACQKFAALYFRQRAKEQGGTTFGRIIGTASESALFMEPGQPNYGPAKAGIINLTVGTAKLLWKYGVTANVVMPRARTRLSHRGPGAAMFDKPEEGFDMFDPANSTPLFGYLCSEEAASITGQAFVVWGKEIKILRRQEVSPGIQNDTAWDLESVHAKLAPLYEGKGVEDAINVFPA